MAWDPAAQGPMAWDPMAKDPELIKWRMDMFVTILFALNVRMRARKWLNPNRLKGVQMKPSRSKSAIALGWCRWVRKWLDQDQD